MHRSQPVLLLTVAACLFSYTNMVNSGDRVPWTTSRMAGTPEPALRLTTERVYPSLSFEEPVDLTFLPGTDWLFISQLDGKVFAFDGSQSDPTPTMIFDVKTLDPRHFRSYALTFHPRFADNRQVFISWTIEGRGIAQGTHVDRFEMTEESPPRIIPESRTEIITWHSGGHNGGCLKFGKDGYLYISAGDGDNPFPPDSFNVGQDLSDLRSTIFRIDVDQTDGDRNYAIPADNPFIELSEARPEVWAYGFRNPWKMNFAPDGRELFTGDVGWELWESVFRVVKAGNYGWSIMEGRQPIRTELAVGPTAIIPPLIDHHHQEARSVTGGYVYRGSRLPDLVGSYIYGDYVTGKVWGLRNEENSVTWKEELADTPHAIITFGENEAGQLFLVDYAGGIYRFIEDPDFGQPSDFPRQLSETGLFADVASQTPADGVLPYSLVAEPWMEGASAERFIAQPGTSSIAVVRNRTLWKYSTGTVFVKTISMAIDERQDDKPADGNGDKGESTVTRKLALQLETQLLHFDGEEWRPYTYIWNDEQTDAEIAPAAGSETTLTIDGQQQTWRFHSRAECNTCHTQTGGFTLGFFPQNLATATSEDSDQLTAMTEWGVFESPIAKNLLRPAIVAPHDESASLEDRSRAYLMLNCAHCHRRGGGGTAPLDVAIEKSLSKTHAIDAVPTQGTFKIPKARVIAPGDPYRSVLWYRMATVGRGHMPHLGARHVDDEGLRLIHDWIASSGDAGLSQSATDEKTFKSLADADAAAVTEAVSQPSDALRLLHAVDQAGLASSDTQRIAAQRVVAVGAVHADPMIRGLFERFLPEAQRTKRLGTLVDPAAILAMPGNISRGRQLFVMAEGVQCRSCHQVDGKGREVGPALDDVGKRQSREQILESILDPSRRIEPKWIANTVLTSDGRVLTGLVRSRTDEGLVLRDTQGVDHTIATSDIDEMSSQPKSLMPELLVQDLTAEQLADLLAYLSSLKSLPR